MEKNLDNSENLTDEQAITLLSEALFSYISEAQNHATDPFEKYALRLQAKVFADPISFKNRCLRGYRILQKNASSPS